MNQRRVMIFTRFERFWHWSQMLLIMLLLFTGFGLHGFHSLISFHDAVNLHTYSALALIVLWIFATFWHFTTGTWRHYIPTSKGLWRVARYYAYGVFKGEHHPYRKAYRRKHNPLQALTYLSLKICIFPAIWLTGLLYLFYPQWASSDSSQLLFWVASIHTAAAFAIVVFIIVHVYLLTVGHAFSKQLQPMINGFDDIELSPEEEAYLEKDEPGQID